MLTRFKPCVLIRFTALWGLMLVAPFMLSVQQLNARAKPNSNHWQKPARTKSDTLVVDSGLAYESKSSGVSAKVLQIGSEPPRPSFLGKVFVTDNSGNIILKSARISRGTNIGKNALQSEGADVFVDHGSETSIAVSSSNGDNLVAGYNQRCLQFFPDIAHSVSLDGNISWAQQIFPQGSGNFFGMPYDPWVIAGNAPGEFYSTQIRLNAFSPESSHAIVARSAVAGQFYSIFYEKKRAGFQDREMVDIDRTEQRGGGTGIIHDGKVYLCYDAYTSSLQYRGSFLQIISPNGDSLRELRISSSTSFQGAQIQPVAGITDGTIYLLALAGPSKNGTVVAYLHEITNAGAGPNHFFKGAVLWPAAGQELGPGARRWGLNGHRIDNHGYLDIDRSSGLRRGFLYIISNWNPNPTDPSRDQGNINLSVSVDGGTTFSSSVIPTASNKTQYFPMMHVDDQGWIHVAYYQNEAGLTNEGVQNASTANIYYTFSTDGGTHWSKAVQVNDAAKSLQYEEPPPNLSGENYYLVGDYAQLQTTGAGSSTKAYVLWTGYDKNGGNPCDANQKERVFCTTVPSQFKYAVQSQMAPSPGDTTKLDQIKLQPRGTTTSVRIRLSNLGLVGFFLDSLRIGGTLNDGFLVTTSNALQGTYIPVSGSYDFDVSINPSQVSATKTGLRSGIIEAYVRTTDPAVPSAEQREKIQLPVNVYVTTTFCLNQRFIIHSGSNYTEVGSEGSIADGQGQGLYFSFDESGRLYDGGVAIANSSLSNSVTCATGPRKVTRQIFQDKFLRCVSDGILDSTAGLGYYNLYLVSVATDVNDSVLVWKNIWEQSTHPDSSDFLLQTVRVINIGSTPIDSAAMGAIYDVDVVGQSSSFENVSGDTTLSYAGRTFWLGWIACNDVAIDPCSPAPDMYGAVVIPGSIGNPGDFVRPRGQVMYEQRGFSYNINCNNPDGGDTLAQRYFWNVNVLTSARDRQYDTLTGAWRDTLSPPYTVCDGDKNNGRPYRNDMGYMTVAKKVYNFPVNGGGQNVVARYGLEGLAASMDNAFSGPGETYTIIHVASVSGLADLMASAVKGIDWYVNHAYVPVGPRQTRLKGDLNNTGDLSPADVVAELNDVFLGIDATGGLVIPVCVADLNNTNDLSPADVVLILNGTFLGSGCPNCLRPCI